MEKREVTYLESKLGTELRYYLDKQCYSPVFPQTLDICGHYYCLRSRRLFHEKFYTIIGVARGELRVMKGKFPGNFNDSESYIVKPKNAIVFRPDYYYKMESIPGGEKPEYCYIGFHGERSSEFVSSIFGKGELAELTQPKQMINRIEEIFDYRESTVQNDLFRLKKFYDVIISLLNDNEGRPKSSGKDKLENLYVQSSLRYMREHYSDPISISDICNYLGISKGYYYQIFSNEMNMSPKKYLLELRMKEAEKFLCDENYSLDTISIKCGFANTNSFSIAFKNYHGISPGLYRKQKSSE